MEELSTIQKIATMAPPLIFAIILHEVAHGWVANKLGDNTARDMGRLTLNPIPHIDLFGTIMMPLFLAMLPGDKVLFGYAKPVPINPYNFKNPKKDMALSSLAGPGINLAMALSFSFLLRIVFPQLENIAPKHTLDWFLVPIGLMLVYGIVWNVSLAIVNMIPIPPLDGSRVVYWLLPDRLAMAYYGSQPYIAKGFLYLLILHIILSVLNASSYSPLLFILMLLSAIIEPIRHPLLNLLLGNGGF